MALIKCIECGKEISDVAASCPHCGYPLAKNNEQKNTLIGRAKEILNSFVIKFKELPPKTKMVYTALLVVLLCVTLIPSGAKRDKALLEGYLLEPSSLTIYDAYTNRNYGDGGRATLFYFGAKNRGGGISDDWALVYDGDVQFYSDFEAAERKGDNKGILENADIVDARFEVKLGIDGWRKVLVS